MWTGKIKTFLERLFKRLKKSLGNTNTRVLCLVSCVLSRFLHLLKTDFNFYVVLTCIKKLHNIYLKALQMNRARWATRPAWRTEGNELNQLKVKMNQKPCYITVFEKPSILFLNNVVSALTITFKNEQTRTERKENTY